jgi:hypothetical protein
MVGLRGLAIVAVVGMAFLGFSAFNIATHQLAVSNTEQVEGVVLDNGVTRIPGGDQPDSYMPYVEYRYDVDGETYVNNNVYPGFGGKSMSFESDVREFLEGYQVNETVTVYVKQNDPESSFLVKTGLSFGMVLFMLIGLGLLFFAGRSVFRS